MPKKSKPKLTPRAIADGIPVWCSYTKLEDITKLRKYPNNPNKHPASQISKLADVIKTNGWRYPIVVSNRSGYITKGNGRLEAAEVLNSKFVPIDEQDYATEADELADVLADNRLAELSERDDKLVNEALARIDELNKEMLAATGFAEKEIQKRIAEAEAAARDIGPESPEDVSPELEGARDIKDDMQFPGEDEWDIPCIKADMCLNPPEDISCWCGRDYSGKTPFYLYNWGSDSMKGLDLTRTLMSFYVDDYRFEPAWEEPKSIAGRLLNMKVIGAIAPNFSTFNEFPRPSNLWSVYRSRWVARYWQECGIKIIPDIQIVERQGKLEPFWLKGLPKNIPAIAIQQHTSLDTADLIRYSVREIKEAVNYVKPEKVLIYAGAKTDEILKLASLPRKVKIIKVPSRNLVKYKP